MKTFFKFGEALKHSDAINYNDEKVEFQQVFETAYGGVSFVALKEGQKLEPHTAPFEVMVNICEGEIEFTMIDRPITLKEGEFLLMGANVEHSVLAKKDSKLMLIKVKD